MNLGSWNVDIKTGNLPQKLATAMGKLQETLIGATYEEIAYLGTQVVNGTNHAVLAEQTVTTGKDTKNIVLLIFNEKPQEIELALVSIERVLESGAPMGGVNIDVKVGDDMGEAQKVFDEAFANFVGSDIKAVALLGTQVTKGTDYFFLASAKAVVPDAKERAVLVQVNPMTKQVNITDILESKQVKGLGYAFNW